MPNASRDVHAPLLYPIFQGHSWTGNLGQALTLRHHLGNLDRH